MKTDNVFKTHPKLKSYQQTSDGTPFFHEADAKVHAKGLEDKTITVVTNTDLIEVIVEDEAPKEPVVPAVKSKAPKRKRTTKKVEVTKAPEAPKAEKNNETKQD